MLAYYKMQAGNRGEVGEIIGAYGINCLCTEKVDAEKSLVRQKNPLVVQYFISALHNIVRLI